MPMIILDSRTLDQTIRKELIAALDEAIDGNRSVELSALPDRLANVIIASGNQTPAEHPIERVCELLDRWEILTNRPKMRGRLVGQIVRACLNIDGDLPPADPEVAKRLWRQWFDANVASDNPDSSTLDKPVSAGECPTDEK